MQTPLPKAAAMSWPLALAVTQLEVSGEVSSSQARACSG